MFHWNIEFRPSWKVLKEKSNGTVIVEAIDPRTILGRRFTRLFDCYVKRKGDRLCDRDEGDWVRIYNASDEFKVGMMFPIEKEN